MEQNKPYKIDEIFNFLRIDSLDFFGQYRRSPNGEFIIAWHDGDSVRKCSGFRSEGEGTYFLLSKDSIILSGRMERPNDGNVADNGTFILNDWMFGGGLKGTFYAIDRLGKILIKKRLEANLNNNGISNDGRFAVCQTCFSDGPDSNILVLCDLSNGGERFRKTLESGWAISYEFDVKDERLYCFYPKIGKFAYSFSGEFLDSERWQTERIKVATGFELVDIAKKFYKDLSKDLDPEKGEKILALLEESSRRGIDRYPRQLAVLHRTMGEVFERLGKRSEAIEHFKKALDIDPGIGVRRRLENLEKAKN